MSGFNFEGSRILLARDEALRARMATAARARALRFSRAAYVDAMLALLEPLLA